MWNFWVFSSVSRSRSDNKFIITNFSSQAFAVAAVLKASHHTICEKGWNDEDRMPEYQRMELELYYSFSSSGMIIQTCANWIYSENFRTCTSDEVEQWKVIKLILHCFFFSPLHSVDICCSFFPVSTQFELFSRKLLHFSSQQNTGNI